jgi:hypothetical protein
MTPLAQLGGRFLDLRLLILSGKRVMANVAFRRIEMGVLDGIETLFRPMQDHCTEQTNKYRCCSRPERRGRYFLSVQAQASASRNRQSKLMPNSVWDRRFGTAEEILQWSRRSYSISHLNKGTCSSRSARARRSIA